jgi:bacillithiol biosynthesis cysteine-adding enzyme BshC
MPSLQVPQTGFLGTSRLFADHAYHFEKVQAFYDLSPQKSDSYVRVARAVEYPGERRARLVEALRAQNQDDPSLELLARPGSFVVATGQQVGLFSGPAYTIYKALTAVKLARELTGRGIAAVPVFWLATEDHDLAEVNHCWVFGAEHWSLRIESPVAGHAQEPVGRIPVGGAPVEDLRRVISEFPFAAEVLARVERAYAPGSAFGEAFASLLKTLLGGHGLLLLDPLQPAIRKLAAPMLRRAAEAAPSMVARLLDRNRELERAGYHAQVRVDEDSSLLFHLEGGRRLPLRGKQAVLRAAGHAEDLSPNALLRPVVQDYLLPTVASVMGPAEVAYMAQAQVLYRELLGWQPVVVSRASFTLADARCGKLMERYNLGLADFFQGEEGLRERIARNLVPPALAGSLERTESAAADRLERLRAELTGFDPTLAEAMDRARRKILYQIGKLERKVGREALRRDQRAAQEAVYLYGMLYPQRQPQERVYSILPFLAKHGLGLIDQIYQNIRLDSPDHQLLVV